MIIFNRRLILLNATFSARSLKKCSITILLVASGLDEIFAQFKVVRMESLKNDDLMQTQQQKGKLLRDSNVTVIQVFPSERANRRIDKVVRRKIDVLEPAATSDLEVLTLTPYEKESPQTSDKQFMKLHIINVRTGKIQDAIMLTTSSNHNDDLASKTSHRTKTPSKSGERFVRRDNKLLYYFCITSRDIITFRHSECNE